MIQCFVKKNFIPAFHSMTEPRLLYVSKIEPDDSIHPRVMHAHKEHVEIVLICSGMGAYSIDGKMYRVGPGDIIVYNSGIVHDEMSGPDVKIGSYCCAVGGLALEGLQKDTFVPEADVPVYASGDCFPRLRMLFELMFSNLAADLADAEESGHYLLQALLSQVWHIVHHSLETPESPADLEPNVLGRRIKEYIDARYMEDISLQTISADLNISSYYLSHVFKDMCGYSPLQYILRRRIGEAQTLLITTDYPVTKIAAMVGYNNPSHFILLFTKNVGMSPRRYKKNYLAEEKKRKK